MNFAEFSNFDDQESHTILCRGHTLLSPQARVRDYCNQEYIRLLCQEHVRGMRQHQDRLWILLTFEMWVRMFEHGTVWSPRAAEADDGIDVMDVVRRSYA
ncbi:MAG TPA: hypothetical protein VLK82_08760 [Candidatus Tectomicrobia bacterium]|nr:hypothetical protein [Candidatus Tectomicrobia bacterium]